MKDQHVRTLFHRNSEMPEMRHPTAGHHHPTGRPKSLSNSQLHSAAPPLARRAVRPGCSAKKPFSTQKKPLCPRFHPQRTPSRPFTHGLSARAQPHPGPRGVRHHVFLVWGRPHSLFDIRHSFTPLDPPASWARRPPPSVILASRSLASNPPLLCAICRRSPCRCRPAGVRHRRSRAGLHPSSLVLHPSIFPPPAAPMLTPAEAPPTVSPWSGGRARPGLALRLLPVLSSWRLPC